MLRLQWRVATALGRAESRKGGTDDLHARASQSTEYGASGSGQTQPSWNRARARPILSAIGNPQRIVEEWQKEGEREREREKDSLNGAMYTTYGVQSNSTPSLSRKTRGDHKCSAGLGRMARRPPSMARFCLDLTWPRGDDE